MATAKSGVICLTLISRFFGFIPFLWYFSTPQLLAFQNPEFVHLNYKSCPSKLSI